MYEYDEQLGDTLALVNVVRQSVGKPPMTELPDARTGNSADCLYYRALKDVGVQSVGTDSMTFADERTAGHVATLWGTTTVPGDSRTVKSPEAFKNVIGAFDHGRLRHYEAGR